jgi:hypothetical protein
MYPAYVETKPAAEPVGARGTGLRYAQALSREAAERNAPESRNGAAA